MAGIGQECAEKRCSCRKTDLTALMHARACQGTAQTPKRLAQTSCDDSDDE